MLNSIFSETASSVELSSILLCSIISIILGVVIALTHKQTSKYNKNFLVTHRIIRVNEEGIVTKGDNNNIEDKEIKKEQILGKVIFQSKLCGFFILYLLKPITLLLIFILIIKDFIFQSLNKENKKNKEVTNVEGKK